MTFEEKKNQFLSELRDLLKKYDAHIGFSVGEGSDTYGLHGEEMVVSMNENEDKTKFAWHKNVLSVDGWHLSAGKISEEIDPPKQEEDEQD